MVLEKTLESPLDCKEIQPVQPKRNQSLIFIGRTDGEAETPILWPPDAKSWLIVKDPDVGKDWSQEEKGTTEDEMVGWHHRLNGHEFEQASGDSEGQGSLACYSPWDCKRVGHDWDWTTKRVFYIWTPYAFLDSLRFTWNTFNLSVPPSPPHDNSSWRNCSHPVPQLMCCTTSEAFCESPNQPWLSLISGSKFLFGLWLAECVSNSTDSKFLQTRNQLLSISALCICVYQMLSTQCRAK